MWRMQPPIAEFLMAREFGWSLEYIRSLEEKDFQMLSTQLEVLYRIDGMKTKVTFENPDRPKI